MFKLNLKIALRNLFKNKVYAIINISGLALGLTALVLLLLYINHEKSYDTWSDDLKNVYKVRERHSFATPDNKEHWQYSNDSRIAALLKSKIPQVQFSTKVDGDWGSGSSVKIENADPVLVKGILDADTAFFKVFPYKFLQGDQHTALDKPNTVVVKKSLALQLFGTEKVLGKTFNVSQWRTDPGTIFTITGVVDDVTAPESLKFTAILHTGDKDADPEHLNVTNSSWAYARLAPGSDTALVNSNVQKAYVDLKKSMLAARKVSFDTYIKEGHQPALQLIGLNEVHANPSFVANWLEKIKPVMIIAAFLLLVSIINFINLSTAQSVQRAKEVGVKKVLGSYKRQLIGQFLIESAIQSLIALFACIVLVELAIPFINQRFDIELVFWHNPQFLLLIGQLVGVFVLITLLAGFYPSWILSNYNPVAVLKGNYGNSLKGVMLRNVLVIFQFVISVTFIIVVGVMHQQSGYMTHKDLGFDKTQLINLRTSYDEGFAERIKRIPGVKYVGTTTQVMGNVFNNPVKLMYKGKEFNINTVMASMDALPALGVKVLQGRIFSADYKQDLVNTVVLNEAAANMLGKHVVGETYDTMDGEKNTFQIIGIIKNYHNEGFDKEVLPTTYKVTNLGGIAKTSNFLIRFDTEQYDDILKKVEAEWKLLYPQYPMTYTSMNESFRETMKDSDRFMSMVVMFSVLSICLSLLGLFALSTFVAKRRTREVAVRKVLGASDFQIVNMLNKSFLWLVIVANVVSWPIAYVLVNRWLEGFSYRIAMPMLPFIMATLISLIIAVFTVSIQARKAALSNPVDALKYE